MQKPSLASIVLTRVEPTMNNGSDVAPAIVTRVWSEHPDGGWTVNLRVMLDDFSMPLSLTSVRLFDEPTVAGSTVGLSAWWPPRA